MRQRGPSPQTKPSGCSTGKGAETGADLTTGKSGESARSAVEKVSRTYSPRFPICSELNFSTYFTNILM